MNGINVQNVSITLGDTPVLRNFSLSVAEGEMIALMGPSGSGKTTLLNCLSRILVPDTGSILGMERPRITYLFAENRLIPHLSGIKNLRLAMESPSDDVAMDILNRLGFTPQEARRQVSQLSFGMARRVAVGRAIAHNGNVYLLDEPVYGLDAATHNLVITELKSFLSGKTGILVTHEADVAQRLASRILTMEDLNHLPNAKEAYHPT
ncbi:ATP-binding cassette domain-containing protein [Eubacteriales bacterium OttesenSCG-928-M02]|nr:ATP-binding cassette domain-containing protein [Eubacteriales bacterium OttesenSCG-928-M02]